jgi:uncharacterized sporulation protein YeaH/YhbH (DUF444 family)
MPAIFIDRRVLNQDRNAENRRKFFNKVKKQLLKSIQDLTEDSISDVDKNQKSVALNKEAIEEPRFAYSQMGLWEYVLSGNSYVVGDLIDKPEGGGGNSSGHEASDSGDSEDDFVFEVNKDEFLQLFFEDLELHNMTDKSIARSDIFSYQRKGFTSSGNPANMDLRRTVRNSLGRRIALRRPKIEELEKQDENETQEEFEAKIARHKRVPYIDPLDLRYKYFEKTPTPTFSAVVFFLMDVSGSMTDHHKDLAKRFFMLMYYFLLKKYTNVEIVYVRHTHIATECDEDEFFYSRETGGTVVLTSLQKIHEIINNRFPVNEWNIYISQASDGDATNDDATQCIHYLNNTLLPIVQYMSFINVALNNENTYISPLMRAYNKIEASNFSMVKATHKRDIFPVFKRLFSKNPAA